MDQRSRGDLGVHPAWQPAQNAFIERFNGTLRTEVLDLHSFRTLEEARAETKRWMRIYNDMRTHRSLGKLPPNEFKARWQRHQSPSETGIPEGYGHSASSRRAAHCCRYVS